MLYLILTLGKELLKEFANGLPMLGNVTSYWKTNLFETTSGNFATPLLKFHMETIGLDRILYSIDYPYVLMEEGAEWINHDVPLHLSPADVLKLKRGRAIELLGLNK